MTKSNTDKTDDKTVDLLRDKGFLGVLRDKRRAEKHTHIKVTGIQLPESFPPASPDLHYQKSGNRSRARTRTFVL